jgi:hypothetical protein
MAVTKYDRPTQFQYRNTLPFQALAAAGAQRQQAYDTNVAKADAISDVISQVQAVKQDNSQKNLILADYENKIETAIEDAGGDYSQLSGFINNMNRDLQKNLSRGKLAAIQTSYNQKQAYGQHLKEMLDKDPDKGGIILEDYNNLLAASDEAYTGIGEINPETETYAVWNGITPAAYVDGNQMALDLANEMDPQVIANTTGWNSVRMPNGEIVYQKGNVKTSKLPAEAIKTAVLNTMMDDPRLMGYLRQHTQYGIGDPDLTQEEKIVNVLNEYANNAAGLKAKNDILERDVSLRNSAKWGIDYQKKVDQYSPILVTQAPTVGIGDQVANNPQTLFGNINGLSAHVVELQSKIDAEKNPTVKANLQRQLNVESELLEKNTALLNQAYEDLNMSQEEINAAETIAANKPPLPDELAPYAEFINETTAKSVYAKLSQSRQGMDVDYLPEGIPENLSKEFTTAILEYIEWNNELTGAQKQIDDRLSDYLSENSAQLSISPQQISLPTAAKDVINENLNTVAGWTFMDVTGKVINDPEVLAKFKNRKTSNITTEAIAGEHWFPITADVVDNNGKVIKEEKLFAVPIGSNNLAQVAARTLSEEANVDAQRAARNMLATTFNTVIENARNVRGNRSIFVTSADGSQKTYGQLNHEKIEGVKYYVVRDNNGDIVTEEVGEDFEGQAAAFPRQAVFTDPSQVRMFLASEVAEELRK